jgi:Fe-S-cluster-containing dehydrogenase component
MWLVNFRKGRSSFQGGDPVRINVDLNKCTGCRTCEIICSFSRNRQINPRKARLEVVRVDKTGLDTPIICVQCDKPKCAEACPEGAISKDNLGIVKVNTRRCVGCGMCADACVMGAIRIDPDSKTPLICDLCDGKPKCIEWCCTNALSLGRSTEKAEKKWHYLLAKSKENVEKWKLPQETLEYVEKLTRKMHRAENVNSN